MSARKLGQLAVDRGVLTQQQVDECLEAQRSLADLGMPKKIGQIFVEKRLLTPDAVRELLGQQGKKKVFAGYELFEKLGQGGMGAVYRGKRVSDGLEVGIKFLAGKMSDRPDFVERFQRESRLAMALDHPHLVKAYEVGVSGERHFMVMEYVSGESLYQMIQRDGRIPEPEAIQIVSQVASALEYAAGRELIHRDIKPANIMLDQSGQAKLLDLGLARKIEPDEQITMTGQIVGTPEFMSPEQIKGKKLDGRSDIYSLGATLYMMVTGEAPFSGETHHTVLAGHLAGQLCDPRQIAPELSDGLVHVIERSMALDPDDRYQTAGRMIEDLTLVAAGEAPKTAVLAPEKTVVLRQPRKRGKRPRRRAEQRPSGEHRARPSSRRSAGRRSNAWVVPAAGGGIGLVLLLLATAALSGGDDPHSPEPTAGTRTNKIRPEARPARSDPRRAKQVEQAGAYRHPSWGFRLALPAGWSLSPAGVPRRLLLSGPGGATATIERAGKWPSAGSWPLDLVAAGEAQRTAWREGGGVVPRKESHESTGGAFAGFVCRDLRVYLSQTRLAIYRFRFRGASRAQATALLDGFAGDAAAERSAPIGTFKRYDQGRFRFEYPEGWAARRLEPGLVRLANGTHELYAVDLTAEQLAQSLRGYSAFRSLRSPIRATVNGIDGALHLGRSGSRYVLQFLAERDGRQVGLVALTGPQTTWRGADSLLWGVLLSLEHRPRAGGLPENKPPKPEPPRPVKQPDPTPPKKASPEIKPLLIQAGGQLFAGFPLNRLLRYYRCDRTGRRLTGNASFRIDPVTAGGQSLRMVRTTMRDCQNKQVLMVGATTLLVSTTLAVALHQQQDGAGRTWIYAYRAMQWTLRSPITSRTEGLEGRSVAQGVYDPLSFPLYAGWTAGLTLRLGTTRTMQVLDSVNNQIVTLTLRVERRERRRLGKEEAARVWRLNFSLDSGPKGTLVLRDSGELAEVTDTVSGVMLSRSLR